MLKTTSKLIVMGSIWATALNPLAAIAAPVDISSATLELSGSVPEIFSLQVRGVPGDLDLSPNVVVNDRLLGIFHFKYNISIATLALTSTTASGLPENGGTAYPFATAMVMGMTCATVAVGFASAGIASTITAAVIIAGTNLGAGTVLTTNGVEEDCPLTGSWVGTATQLPVAGIYSETLTLTMTST